MKMKHLFALVAITAGLLLSISSPAGTYAETEYSENSRVEEAVDEMSHKFWRGFVNVLTGLGEFPRQMSIACNKAGAGGIPVGFLNGVLMTVVRTGVGAFEVGTFPVPIVPDDHNPSGATYAPIMQPAFVWQSE